MTKHISKIDEHRFRDLLNNRRDKLTDLVAAASDATAPVQLDQQLQGRLSRMDALQVQAMASATNDRRRIEIAQIDSALRQMEIGKYGYCVECGDKIPAKRIELNPAVARCIECAT
ncbi:MAG: molecular chaperone DnaK [Pelagibacteraceae bacterium]|nr:molecular chaperone DnaK [Pelagibacteraceae bacterium]|tara:strand:+ start:6524 stop:6871 length:348 start_codon:yes stop_codon:yes gene_type:complete